MPPTTPAQPPIPIAITICGDGGCGKSSITLRLVRQAWTSDYDPTIEDSYSVTRTIDGVTYHLSLTDTAGQEEYRGMWASSNLGADAFLLVYDITSEDSLHALQYFNDLIDMEAETRLDNADRAIQAGIPPSQYGYGMGAGSGAKMVPPIKMVAGNKCDLQASRQVTAQQGMKWARGRGCGFMETSAFLMVNIEETFASIIRRVAEARRMAEMGVLDQGSGLDGHLDRRGVTKPLSPLPSSNSDEKGRAPGVRGPHYGGREKLGRGGGSFWRSLRCW
ncbi:putative ras small monomeric protein [Zalerion maritima]|uniref:Ras small monomeric protein n=1 Tax=Zalerion maritima TaxID=339359 RepID=A0AAD5RX77_9PEZI|nr:putative ras small monomeric protein [Zalerion maritima]